MKLFSHLKTSEKISLSFSLFSVVSLLLFLFLLNITYFWIWYNDQKRESFENISQSYQKYLNSEGSLADILILRQALLSQDTVIIPEMGALVCSPSVEEKIGELEVHEASQASFLKIGGVYYFIYSEYYDGIGEIKVFFDTTQHIKSQLLIIKISLLFIVLVAILQFYFGQVLARYLLRNLARITEKVKNIGIHDNKNHIICENIPKDDEIRILAEALNLSYATIAHQTSHLKQFLTDVSHEFKTPLMVMGSNIDLLEKKSKKHKLMPEDIDLYFQKSRHYIAHMNSLLETLFFLSRLEENPGCLVTQELDIRAYLESKLSSLGEKFPQKHLSFSLDVEISGEFKVEKQTFGILLDNLLSNAMKFSPDDVEIDVLVRDDYMSIADNGIGIEKEKREKIWEKFYRKDTNKEGFGIGLYIVKRICNLYNWSIRVDAGKEKGTIFIMQFNHEKDTSHRG